MRGIWKRFRVGAIIVSCCILALGILMVLWPDTSAAAVCIVFGVLCVATGIYELVRYFKLGFAAIFFQYDLALGVCDILAGALLLSHPYSAAAFLPVAAGVYMMIGSVLDIQASVEMHRYRLGNWGMSLVLGIVSILFTFFLLMNPFHGVKTLMICIGVSLMVSSIQSFYMIHCMSKVMKASHDDRIIDAEWNSVDF